MKVRYLVQVSRSGSKSEKIDAEAMIELSGGRLFNRPTDQIWTSNLIGRFASGHQSNLSDCDLDNLDYLDNSM
jgi:hypothetical protein